jgi:putative glutamine amidotransferase
MDGVGLMPGKRRLKPTETIHGSAARTRTEPERPKIATFGLCPRAFALWVWSNEPSKKARYRSVTFSLLSNRWLKIMASRKPLIGIPADRRILGKHPFHCVGEKYITAVAEGANAIPVLIPSLGEALDLTDVLSRVDGVLLTGSASNVEPHRYSGPGSEPGTWHDPHRDATTLPMIPLAVRAGLPILAVCRGFQEMNVAFGGTLHQKLHEVGFNDHRDDESQPLEVQYAPAHEVVLSADGLFRRWMGRDRMTVNSLHSQGVNALGKGLSVEATAPDGVIEAFRVTDAPAFAVAVQWHPEWQFATNEFSRALFAAFGEAAAKRASQLIR